MPVSDKNKKGTINGDNAVLTALKTAASATLPLAINTRRGEETSVGRVPSKVWPAASGPLPKNRRPVSHPAIDIGP